MSMRPPPRRAATTMMLELTEQEVQAIERLKERHGIGACAAVRMAILALDRYPELHARKERQP